MGIFYVNGKKNVWLLLVLVVLIEGGGFLSGFLSGSGQTQYLELIKPTFSPPSWVFPVVWPILYFLIAVALYRILLQGRDGLNVKRGVALFTVQIILNYLWSILFFGFNLYGIAFIELLLLLIFIILTIIEFRRIDKTAACLMVPYLLWVSFAAVLNYSIWMLNR